MPRLIFPVAPGGELIVDARVNLGSREYAAAVAAGVAQTSIPVKAQIDTGSNITVVSRAVLQTLGARPGIGTTTQGVGGQIPVWFYEVTLFIVDVANPQFPAIAIPDLKVIDMPSQLDHDILVGTDVLLQCRLYMDGPNGYFTLDY